MISYYKLYDDCRKIIDDMEFKKQTLINNKKKVFKKKFYDTITKDLYNKIYTRAKEGYKYIVIYDDEYNSIIDKMKDELKEYFNPFSIVYKRKSFSDRGIMEIITEEINYILILDWRDKSSIELESLKLNKEIQTEHIICERDEINEDNNEINEDNNEINEDNNEINECEQMKREDKQCYFDDSDIEYISNVDIECTNDNENDNSKWRIMNLF
tara:strand:- start:818 stop:1456 length:639 start_codon:yes stop_codon:yes gene_type:complete